METTQNIKLEEFVNLEGNVHKLTSIGVPTYYPVQELEFKGEIVLYFQAENKHSSYAVIPGFKASEEYKTEFGCSAVKIRKISDERKRKEISDLIREKVEGPINFWPVEAQ